MITRIQKYDWRNPDAYPELDIPKSSMQLGKHFNFTKRIKYVTPKDVQGNIKEPILYVEIEFNDIQIEKYTWLFKNPIYVTTYCLRWIPSDAFFFDFSDEYTEEVYTCQ